jgi:hypothetical protein
VQLITKPMLKTSNLQAKRRLSAHFRETGHLFGNFCLYLTKKLLT